MLPAVYLPDSILVTSSGTDFAIRGALAGHLTLDECPQATKLGGYIDEPNLTNRHFGEFDATPRDTLYRTMGRPADS